MVNKLIIILLLINSALSLCNKNNFKKTMILNLDKAKTSNIFLDSEAGIGLQGHDARNTYDDTDEELFKIKKYLEMKKILLILESKKISTLDKLDIINDYNILEYKLGENIYAGGLLDDWNF
tara:strand:- start:475 stop:840 length:366 start_codon:yes stop_codon:yes gene_type:complete